MSIGGGSNIKGLSGVSVTSAANPVPTSAQSAGVWIGSSIGTYASGSPGVSTKDLLLDDLKPVPEQGQISHGHIDWNETQRIFPISMRLTDPDSNTKADPFVEVIDNNSLMRNRTLRGDAKCIRNALWYYVHGHPVRVFIGSTFLHETETEVTLPPMSQIFDSLTTDKPFVPLRESWRDLSAEAQQHRVDLLRNGYEYHAISSTFKFDHSRDSLEKHDDSAVGRLLSNERSRKTSFWSASEKPQLRMQIFQGVPEVEFFKKVCTRSLFTSEMIAQGKIENFMSDGFLYFVCPSAITQFLSSAAMALISRYDGETSDNQLW